MWQNSQTQKNSMRKRMQSTLSYAFLALMVGIAAPLAILLTTSSVKVQAQSFPAYQYTKTFDATNGSAYPTGLNCLRVDSQGNIYVTGQFNGTIIFDGPGGSDSVTTPATNTFLTKYNPDGSYAWTKTFDESSAGSRSDGRGIAIDNQDNVYLASYFHGTVKFDGPGGTHSVTSAHDTSAVTKFNANGTYAWTKTIDASAASSASRIMGIGTDANGNLYYGGSFNGTTIMDGPGGSDSVTAAASQDTFITKYNANGTYAWTKTFDDTLSTVLTTVGLAVDNSGDTYITGQFNGTVKFDGQGGTDARTVSQQTSYLTKYDANGGYGWTKTIANSGGGSNFAQTNTITVDTHNNVYISGTLNGTATFDGPGGSDTVTANNQTFFLTRYNANASYGWTKIGDAQASSSAGTIGSVTDEAGNVYVTGYFVGTVSFDGPGGSDVQTAASSNGDCFTTSYTSSGAYKWTKTFDTSIDPNSFAEGDVVAVNNKTGVLYVAGDIAGQVNFGGTDLTDIKDGGPSDTVSLTAYRVFTPVAGQTSGVSNSGAATPGAPSTGYGQYRDYIPIVIVSITSALLCVVGASSKNLALKRHHSA